MTKSTVVGLAMLVGAGAAARAMAPELQRYLRIRKM
jgi:hypothetical protein